MEKIKLEKVIYVGRNVRLPFFYVKSKHTLHCTLEVLPTSKTRGKTKEQRKAIYEAEQRFSANFETMKNAVKKMSRLEQKLFFYDFKYIDTKSLTFTELTIIQRQKRMQFFMQNNG